MRRQVPVVFIIGLTGLLFLAPGVVWAESTEKAITLDDLEDKEVKPDAQPGMGGFGGVNVNPLRQGLPGKAHDDPALQTQITGYVVTSYKYNDSGVGHHDIGNEMHFGQSPAETNDFAFDLIAFGFTRRFSDWAWVNGSVEVGQHNGHNGLEVEVDLDQGDINLMAPIGNGLIFTLGKINSPVSFEQEDAPFLLQVSQSLAYQFASPVKMTGAMFTYPFALNLEVRGMVFNGWETNGDNNDATSALFQVGWAPYYWLNTKLSYLWGPEAEGNDHDARQVVDFVATLSPYKGWLIGMELAYGWDNNLSTVSPGEDAKWWSGQVTVHHDFTRWFATTLRYSFFKDQDGRPDLHDSQKRTMQEVTIAPVFHLSPDFMGYMGMGMIPQSQHLISGVDLRFEYRRDWVDEGGPGSFFEDEKGNPTNFRNSFFVELVARF